MAGKTACIAPKGLSIGLGGLSRSDPVGGCAKGMPLKASILFGPDEPRMVAQGCEIVTVGSATPLVGAARTAGNKNNRDRNSILTLSKWKPRCDLKSLPLKGGEGVYYKTPTSPAAPGIASTVLHSPHYRNEQAVSQQRKPTSHRAPLGRSPAEAQWPRGSWLSSLLGRTELRVMRHELPETCMNTGDFHPS